jgi:hypothetical protein
MGSGWKVVRLGAWLTAALALGACGGEDDDGTPGSEGGAGGSSGEDAKECTLASTEGLTYSGTCLYADHCSDQYDTAFGPALLEQACVAQSGTWSTTPCNPADWEILCTQAVLGGVYLQYMRDDGGCILGCEEKL